MCWAALFFCPKLEIEIRKVAFICELVGFVEVKVVDRSNKVFGSHNYFVTLSLHLVCVK